MKPNTIKTKRDVGKIYFIKAVWALLVPLVSGLLVAMFAVYAVVWIWLVLNECQNG